MIPISEQHASKRTRLLQYGICEQCSIQFVELYKSSKCLTVDKQLFPYRTRGRTRFTQYIPSKPATYGIKVMDLWCREFIHYVDSCIPEKVKLVESNQDKRVIKDLAALYRESGKNITMDNFFTLLTEHLLSWNLTIVGTLKKNKKYIPEEIKPDRSRPEYSSFFAFRDRVTLCHSYVP